MPIKIRPSCSDPNNIYAQQLAEGFKKLKFNKKLENEYLEYIRITQRQYQKIAVFLALFIWIAFALIDVARLDILNKTSIENPHLQLILLVRWSTMALLVAIALLINTGKLNGKELKALAAVILCVGVSTTIIIILYKLEKIELSDSALLLVFIVIFFPLGLSFYESLTLAFILYLTTLLTGIFLLEGTLLSEHIRLTRILFLAVIVGAVGGYIREHMQREQFLLRHLLDWQANHDPLTKLNNRRSFNQHIETAIRQAQRQHITLALIMIDIDHFKPFNDHYGHADGDQALRLVGEALQPFARRPMDMAVRLGGEEFALFLYDANQEQASKLALQLQNSIRHLKIQHEASPSAAYLTISLGVAIAKSDDNSETLYQRADQLLYEAKRTGRDKAVIG